MDEIKLLSLGAIFMGVHLFTSSKILYALGIVFITLGAIVSIRKGYMI